MRMPLRSTVIGPLLAAVLAVSAIAVAGTWSTREQQRPGVAPKRLRITGQLEGMYPGRKAVLRLRIRNPLGARVRVTRVTATVHPGVGPMGACPARSLRIEPWRGRRSIAPWSSRVFRLQVRMRRRAPNRCQGTRWTLTYRARSVKV